jgi:hypothetical protein
MTYARMQTCACGNGCEGRSAIKYGGRLIVDCVPDDRAQSIIDAIARCKYDLTVLDYGDDWFVNSRGTVSFSCNARLQGYGPPLPLHPFEDTVPMLPPDEVTP